MNTLHKYKCYIVPKIHFQFIFQWWRLLCQPRRWLHLWRLCTTAIEGSWRRWYRGLSIMPTFSYSNLSEESTFSFIHTGSHWRKHYTNSIITYWYNQLCVLHSRSIAFYGQVYEQINVIIATLKLHTCGSDKSHVQLYLIGSFYIQFQHITHIKTLELRTILK